MEGKDVLKQFAKIKEGLIKTNSKIVADPNQKDYVQKIMFDSPTLTYLYSGFPLGRIHQFFGPPSHGKSTISAYIAGQLQKKVPELIPGKQIVVWIDFERTFDKTFNNSLGLNTDEEHFVLLRPLNAEEAFSAVEPLIKTESVCCVVLDSDAAMPTRAATENEIGKASFGGTARFLSDELKRLNLLIADYNCTYIQISQERANMNVMAHLPSQTGGESIKFYASVRNRITKIEDISTLGEPVGIKIRIRNYKNKCPGCVPWRDSEVQLNWKNGIDSDLEYIEFIKKFELIKVAGGGNFSSDEFGFKVRGQPALIEWMQNNPKQYDLLKARVLERLLTKNNDEVLIEPGDDSVAEETEETPPDLTQDLTENN